MNVKIKAENVADFRRQLVDAIIAEEGEAIHHITEQMMKDREEYDNEVSTHDHLREWDNDCERCQLEREQCANEN